MQELNFFWGGGAVLPFFFLVLPCFFSNLLGGVVVELLFLRSFWVVLFSPSFSWCCQFAASPFLEVGSSLFRNESSGLFGVVLFSRFFPSWWCCCLFLGGAVFCPSPLVGGAAVGGAALRLLSPLVWCWFLHPPFWCCLLSPSLWCVVLFSPPFLWCSFSASPLWVVLLAFSLLFLWCCLPPPPCGAAAVLL